MDSSFTERWIRKFRFMTLSLIFSGALNIGLMASLIAVLVQERQNSLSVTAPRASEKVQELTNLSILQSYSHLSFRELCALLTNQELVEEGLTKRDLALAALVSFHDFNLEKAMGGILPQRRALKLDDKTLELFPGLSEDQYQAILHFAYLERWPLTSHGLFAALQKAAKPRDDALVQAFMVTPEFYALQTLFQKSETPLPDEQLIDLISEGNWQVLDGFVREQVQMLDFSPERRRQVLISYLALSSPTAAAILLQSDFAFALKRLNDQGLIDLLSRVQPSETLQKFCIELLGSARSDAIYEKSAALLYRMANEEMPQPFDRANAIARFVPRPAPVAAAFKKAAASTAAASKKAAAPAIAKTHVVQAGDSLWKIARRYHVKVEDLMAINHLDKDKLKMGSVLKIPSKARQ